MRQALVDGFLELTGAQAAQLTRGPVGERVAIVRRALAAWAAEATFEVDVEKLVTTLLAKEAEAGSWGRSSPRSGYATSAGPRGRRRGRTAPAVPVRRGRAVRGVATSARLGHLSPLQAEDRFPPLSAREVVDVLLLAEHGADVEEHAAEGVAEVVDVEERTADELGARLLRAQLEDGRRAAVRPSPPQAVELRCDGPGGDAGPFAARTAVFSSDPCARAPTLEPIASCSSISSPRGSQAS